MDELRNRLIQIYDEYRTALLNGKYYARRLALYRNLDLWSEIVAALGTSSAIGSWALWKTTFGANGWTLLAGAAVIVSLLKPILQFGKSREKYAKLFSGYNSLGLGFRFLIAEVKIKKAVDESQLQTVHQFFDQLRELAKDDDPHPPTRLLHRLVDEVNQEVPPSSLWMPARKEKKHDGETTAATA